VNIKVYYPTSDNAVKTLQHNITKVHTAAVKNYVSKMTCPLAQKTRIINAIQETHKSKVIAPSTKHC